MRLGSYRAQILLHEPHAKLAVPGDVSAARVMYGARAILDLMYAISSTSYDVSLLDHSPIVRYLSLVVCMSICG